MYIEDSLKKIMKQNKINKMVVSRDLTLFACIELEYCLIDFVISVDF